MERSSYEMYQIEVTETTPVEGGTVTRHYPTFYLHPDVQGIVNAEDAAKIALRIAGAYNPEMRRVGSSYRAYVWRHCEEAATVIFPAN